MRFNKVFMVVLVCLTAWFSFLPNSLVRASAQGIQTAGAEPAPWPVVFSPYLDEDGGAILDPAGDEHPIDVDITSGVDRGMGLLPSMYVASDGDNFFVRLRLKGDPYDRKGGFLSSVWLVQMAVGGVHQATIGLDGKSPSTDYVYVASADGSVVRPVYATDTEAVCESTGRSLVPGTCVVPAENGQYFLDFQVPIAQIEDVASIASDAPVQLFFGTSKAANLSVINKEYMDTESNGGASVDFTNSSSIQLEKQPLSVAIDGGSSKSYSSTSNVMTGTSSLVTGSVSISINNGAPGTAAINGHSWSYTLPSDVTSQNGIYKATVSVTSGNDTAAAHQDIMVDGRTDSLTINGGAIAVTSSPKPTVSGTFVTQQSNNFQINLIVQDSSGNQVEAQNGVDTASGTWTTTLANSLQEGAPYYLTANMTEKGNNKPMIATTKQQLTYRSGAVIAPISINIGSLPADGSASPAISGTSSGADQVEVRIDGTSTEFVVPQAGGAWNVSALEKPLTTGDHTITAIAANSSGNTASATAKYTVTATSIAIDNGGGTVTNDNQPTFRGNTNAGDGTPVTVTIDGKSYGGTAKNHRWEISMPNDVTIPDGTYNIAASIANATAQQSLTIDSGTAVQIQTPANGSTISATKPTFSGTAEAGASLSLKLTTSNDQVVWMNDLVVSGSGSDSEPWTYTPTEDLPLGSYTITAMAADPYGNEAAAASSFIITNEIPDPVQQPDPEPQPLNGGTDILTYSFEGYEAPASVQSATYSVYAELPYGTNVTNLIADFSLSDGASASIDSDNQTSGITANDFSSPVVYTVKAEDGTTQDWTVYVSVAKQDQTEPPDTPDTKSYTIDLTASPSRIAANGTATSLLTATVQDEDGNLVPGVPVTFAANHGDFVDANGETLGSSNAVTNDRGVAQIRYRSEKIRSAVPVDVQVQASVDDTERGLHGEKAIDMWLEPAVVAGVITNTNPTTGAVGPVAGVTVTIKDGEGHVIGTATTAADGSYSFPIADGNQTYAVEYERTIGSGANARTIVYKQKAVIDETLTGEGQTFQPNQTITGIVGQDKGGGLQPIQFGQIEDPAGNRVSGSEFRAYLKKPDGTYVDDSGYELDENGLFVADGLPADPSIEYALEIHYEYSVKKPDGTFARQSVVVNEKEGGTFPKLSVGEQGEMNINEELIDPFGVVTDASTGLPVPGVHLVLTYADTKRNRDNGIVPGTQVALPALPGFAPNDNANPQDTDADGNYAYMVYGYTDYIITATHDGYQPYRSGVIGVDGAIVHWDIDLTPIVGGGGTGSIATPASPEAPAPATKTDVTVNVSVGQRLYEENGTGEVTIGYVNNADTALTSGTVTLTLPEGSVVTDADGGAANSDTIVWDIAGLGAGQKGIKTVRIRFPAIGSSGKTVEIQGRFSSEGQAVLQGNEESSVKVMLFSNRFGEIGHDRYILGFPDGDFKPQRSLTRAELAAIVARLTDGGNTEGTAEYSDVPSGFWASGYIREATDSGLFSGYEDGSFRPNQAVSREELAAVMARYLKLSQPEAIDNHFIDTAGRWSDAAIEALYRNGMVQGYSDGTFRPGNPITRLEAVALINRMLFRGPLTGTEQSFPDVAPANWGFGDVEEATLSHDSTRSSDGSESMSGQVEDNVH